MRKIDCHVSGQNLIVTSGTSGLISGSRGYLQLHFIFDRTWIGYCPYAKFYINRNEITVDIENCCCLVPDEAADRSSITFTIYGEKDGETIVTNKVIISQQKQV